MSLTREGLKATFEKMYRNKTYRIFLFVLGVIGWVFAVLSYFSQKGSNRYAQLRKETEAELKREGLYEGFLNNATIQSKRKQTFFGLSLSPEKEKEEITKAAEKRFGETVDSKTAAKAEAQGVKELSLMTAFTSLMDNGLFFFASLIFALPMYLLMVVYQNPIIKYMCERLFMMIFVVFGVTFLVFTILYFSPMKPAENILGDQATDEQIEAWNEVYGLNEPYIVRLWVTFENLITFDLGNSYQGNEDVARAIALRFPTTMQLGMWSLLVSVSIAIPAGIISAIKQYSSFDYIFMFVALIGLSIPNFWLGLILILNFSINLGWLPATFVPGEMISFLMPAIVLGTGMSASVARMTRSSMLEVKSSDYILTAKAKGLSESKVVLKHILGNAMIPIITVVGLQFGGMMGGSSVTEKVFNVSGLGSYIVDKQFIPDIPVVMAGVVYIAVVISIANLLVDILYAFLDPRIKSKMKNY